MSASLALVSLPAGLYHYQPLGFIYLIAWLRHVGMNNAVRIIDSNWEDPYEVLRREQFDYVGISAMSGQYEAATRLASWVKAETPMALTMIGGCHISTCPESRRQAFDISVPGEGERRLAYILGDRPSFSVTEPVQLETFPDLDYSLLNPGYYRPQTMRVWRDTVRVSNIITSRGCPYRCPFCSTTVMWNHHYRAHTAEWVIRQVVHNVELGVDTINVLDDLFTVKRDRLQQIVELWERAGLHRIVKRVSVASRANILDHETCDLLDRINTKLVGFGWESGDEKTLNYLKAGSVTVSMNQRATRICLWHKIEPLGSLMLGVPGETVRQMLQTIRFILWLTCRGVPDCILFVAVPYPGTEFWRVALERGKVSADMNFDRLFLHMKMPGEVLLSDVPRWQFIIVWWLAQLALLPMKARKAAILAWAWLRRIV